MVKQQRQTLTRVILNSMDLLPTLKCLRALPMRCIKTPVSTRMWRWNFVECTKICRKRMSRTRWSRWLLLKLTKKRRREARMRLVHSSQWQTSIGLKKENLIWPRGNSTIKAVVLARKKIYFNRVLLKSPSFKRRLILKKASIQVRKWYKKLSNQPLLRRRLQKKRQCSTPKVLLSSATLPRTVWVLLDKTNSLARWPSKLFKNLSQNARTFLWTQCRLTQRLLSQTLKKGTSRSLYQAK